uniref:Uncharacterized protein n=1 Tax=Oreochromis niloticus TaxID=8128 RepID=A0A669CCL3_ORENI
PLASWNPLRHYFGLWASIHHSCLERVVHNFGSTDVMIYLSNPTNSFTRLVQLFDIFSKYSGCKIHIQKIFMFNCLPDQNL